MGVRRGTQEMLLELKIDEEGEARTPTLHNSGTGTDIFLYAPSIRGRDNFCVHMYMSIV